MICNMLGCATEAYANVMFYHFEEGSSKHYCQQIMRFCINPAKLISRDDRFIRPKYYIEENLDNAFLLIAKVLNDGLTK